MKGNVPCECGLPTGLGKTAVIPIWLIAAASGARLPRRLIYVVNRRTVVDQATDVATQILARLHRSAERDKLPWANASVFQGGERHRERTIAEEHAPALSTMCKALATLAGDHDRPPLAVSTLRGELADNGEWRQSPARLAIVVGTVDMIGSKLLFSGYGDGRYARAHHAGLVGQDALVVHDEAHLEPAFDALLASIQAEQGRASDTRVIQVMRLSATARPVRSSDTSRATAQAPTSLAANGGPTNAFSLTPAEMLDPIVRDRLDAKKHLLLDIAGEDKLCATIVTHAKRLGAQPGRILIYVRSPKTASTVAALLSKALGAGGTARVALLTGTIRGHERDALAKGPILSAFRPDPSRSAPEASLFLVSTSAGEVGADWDADHLVCDLTTLDSMAQRFGRVNRRGGESRQAQIVVVMTGTGAKATSLPAAADDARTVAGVEDAEPPKRRRGAADGYEEARRKTGQILCRVMGSGADVSPAGLGRIIAGLSEAERKAAFSPVPKILSPTDILFDHWSMTSVGWTRGPEGRWRDALPGRPAVEPYLHGVAEWESPETHIAWRSDLRLLATAGGKDEAGEDLPSSQDDLKGVFDAFPLRTAEQLRDRTDRVQRALAVLARRLRKEPRTVEGPVPRPDSTEPERDPKGLGAADIDHAPDLGRAMPATLAADPWVVVIRGSAVRWVRLSELAPESTRDREEAVRLLAFATVVLPVEAGGLREDGLLDGAAPAPENDRDLDIAEESIRGTSDRQRVVVHSDGREFLLRDLPAGGAGAFVTRHFVSLAGSGDTGADTMRIEYRVARGAQGELGERIGLTAHNDAVREAATRIALATGLEAEEASALQLAANWHDSGKARTGWQRYAMNDPHREIPGGPIAKSDRYQHPRSLAGYRHELGSLHDAGDDSAMKSLDPDMRDLVLHLIAAHHGWGRPHFESRHFDRGDPSPGRPRTTADNERLAVEVMQRFGRLQHRYGRWGLAWLESILRCADAEASTPRARVSPMTNPTDRRRAEAFSQSRAVGEGGAT
ncbi:MAG TPA: type I-U CRISPR-associated helicase/endonuclease Cas3 [Phycisphaerales bacterium]|nr:type I-U CRISPR-associated helicase/endonuclease Cas3 [Phycisphaerales bacterium]HMP36845.1 type I-U CRISPR-associated helicase/endonuclease Cas3 [Phycisphaerales bacterium]